MSWGVLALAAWLACGLAPAFGQAGGEGIVAGRKVKLFSKVLNEEREILVSLPAGYDRSLQRYPVLFVADGSEGSLIASGGLLRYFSPRKMPPMIAVFIPNTDRGRDYSISARPLEQLPNSGGQGGENFLRFLTEELLPYVDAAYRTTGYRIFAGFSATGGFVFYTLLSRPDCFDAYIAASPSVFFEEELLEKTRRFFLSHPTLDKFLFVPYFERDLKTTTRAWPPIERIIREAHPRGFRCQVKTYPGQGHVPPTALFDGLMALFEDWEPVREPEVFPGGGLLPPGKSFSVELQGFGSEVRYTLDGTEPTRESPLYGKPLVVSRPLAVKAKSFRGKLGESRVTVAEFRFGASPVAREKGPGWKPGLLCQYYDRRWFILPDAIEVEPTRTGVARGFDISSRTREDGFLFQFDGFLHVPAAGSYRFYLLSTAPGKFFLGGDKVIDNPGGNAGGDPLREGRECSGEMHLSPGFYPVRAVYSNCWLPGQTFRARWEGPGLAKQDIPPGALYHEPPAGGGPAEAVVVPGRR